MNNLSITAAANGIYRADAATLRDATRSAGCSWVELELADVTDKLSLLCVMAAGLQFPEGFGANWDALADCLQDLSWLPGRGCVLVLKDNAGLAAAAPVAHDTLLKILAAAAADWQRRQRVFVVFAGFPPTLPAFPGT